MGWKIRIPICHPINEMSQRSFLVGDPPPAQLLFVPVAYRPRAHCWDYILYELRRDERGDLQYYNSRAGRGPSWYQNSRGDRVAPR